MKKIFQSRLFVIIVGVLLIVVGVMFAIRYVRGTINAYRAIEFARENNFMAGNPNVDLLQPWMNLRYIAVSYTVPQSFLFDKLGLEMNRVNSELPVGRLNRHLRLGAAGDEPVLLGRVRQAILDYRENPVVTGLVEGGVRPWMSVQYVANSTGVPADYIFEQIGLPLAGNAFIPLERLVDVTGYEAGLRTLVEQIQQAIETYQEPQQ